VRKISPPPGFDPQTVLPVASRYTYYATRPTDFERYNINIWKMFKFGAGEGWCWRRLVLEKVGAGEGWCWRRMERITWDDCVRSECIIKIRRRGISLLTYLLHGAESFLGS